MNTTPARPTVIFTDLDGTLLDSDTCRWDAALPALTLASAQQIPVIPCTSRTLAECLLLQTSLPLNGPLIFENGAGLALPQTQFKRPTTPPADDLHGYWVCRLARPYSDIRQILNTLRQRRRYQFRGLGDMSVEQISEHAGLDIASAELARQRRHSESLLWLDDAKSFDTFAKDIEENGLTLSRGSRFLHISSPCNKGQAMLGLVSFYTRKLGQRPHLIALGDSANDLSMLRAADTAVIIRSAQQTPLPLQPKNDQQTVIVSEHPGPEGWNRVVHRLLSEALSAETP